MYETIEEAMNALREAEVCVATDMGEEALEAGYSDLVHSIASLCPDPVVMDELFRRTGVGERV